METTPIRRPLADDRRVARYRQQRTIIPIGRPDSLIALAPAVAAEWDYEHEANRGLSPKTIRAQSNHRAAWICGVCGHDWRTRVGHRAGGFRSGCPKSRFHDPMNTLAGRFPAIAAEWDYAAPENEGRTPEKTRYGSPDPTGWACGDCGHRWTTRVTSRTSTTRTSAGSGCPRWRRHEARSIAALYPAIAAEWDYDAELNAGRTPANTSYAANTPAQWRCGKCDHTWVATVGNRTTGKTSGPRATSHYENSLEALFPQVAAEWDYAAKENEGRTPATTFAGTTDPTGWACSECGERWVVKVHKRTRDGSGCPHNSNGTRLGKMRIVLRQLGPDLLDLPLDDRTALLSQLPLEPLWPWERDLPGALL